MWAMIGVSIAMILWTAVVSYLDKREARKCLSEQSETETIRNEEMTVIDEKT